MLNEIYDDTKEHMDKSIEAMRRDFKTLRTGKVSTAILDNVKVDYYGVPTPLNQAANVLATDATTISINPWEKSMVGPIEKAIAEANVGVHPNNDGESVKLYFPPMTTDQREGVVKQAKQMAEKAKVAVRNIRKDSNNTVKELEKEKEVTQDESKGAHDTIQKITDEHIDKIESLLKDKSEEIMKV
jgi:ribosome recycling factor